ncbi:MAG TPA: patatin [Verrucomicrobiae bacterium]|jgi:hypothetical protein|nr:patatin [Verrucomicrobiae bacterium]
MNPPKVLYWLVWIIAVSTLISGLVQMIDPAFVLRLVRAETTSTTKHFFAIVGMFMTLFGGMLLHALYAPAQQSVAVFWAGLQKFGASIAVALGVERNLFAVVALGIAAFDFASGILVLWYWAKTRAGRNLN